VSDQDHTRRPPQFTVRTALVAMTFVALAFGWYVSMRRANLTIAQLQARARHARSESLANKFQARDLERDRSRVVRRPKGILSGANLDGANLRGISIVGDASAFQRTCFNNADRENASLSGSFQYAQFDHANLVNATLTGDATAFQRSSFVNADLSGAVLTGSFQVSSFAGAKLIGTRFLGSRVSFQGVNIDGAQFQGADLSAIHHQNLESCYFQAPPLYDEKTRFPDGFDPVAQLWGRATK
jgi:uncharacterized protein YjbI with pentapeptide repeats